MATDKDKKLTSLNFRSSTRGRDDVQTRNKSAFEEFIIWYALPRPQKIKLGIETQKDFAEYNHITERTLTNWIDRPEFMPRVRALWKKWGQGRTPTVIQAIYNSAVGGGKEAPQAQKLWMQVIEDFSEKQDVKVTEEKKVVLSVNDIRYAIEQLPEPMRTKCYGYLREITEDIIAIRNSRDIEDDDWNERPTQAISIETDNDAQDVRYIESTNEVAKSDTPSVCRDMVNAVSKSHNQSAERWW